MAQDITALFSNTYRYSNIAFTLLLAKDSGIFSTLLSADQPLTSAEIAEKNKLKERYTREILGCLCSTNIVRVKPGQNDVMVYDLEAESKALLSKKPFIPQLNFLKIMMTRYQNVRDCIDTDKPGGVPYCQNFFDTVDEISKLTAEATAKFLLETVPHLKERLESGIDVIEFGCSSAHVLALMASMFPASTFTVSDIVPHVVEEQRKIWGHVSNMKFLVLDMCVIPPSLEHTYDWALAYNVIHDLPHPLDAMKGARRIVKEDNGVFTFVDKAGTGSHLKDVGDLTAGLLYSVSTFLCLPDSFQQEDSEAHGACWGKQTALDLAAAAGFDTEAIHRDAKTVCFIAKPI